MQNTSLSHFADVAELDPSFYKVQVNMRMAELLYRQGDYDEAMYKLALIES